MLRNKETADTITRRNPLSVNPVISRGALHPLHPLHPLHARYSQLLRYVMLRDDEISSISGGVKFVSAFLSTIARQNAASCGPGKGPAISEAGWPVKFVKN